MVAQPRLRILYKASEFLVSASAFETLGMTVAEANICGIPVIVQSATGFSTQVAHGQNGFLIDFEDRKGARQAIKEAIEARPSAEEIAAVMNSDSFWFSKLPSLDEEVIKMARIGGDKSQWGSGYIPLWLMLPGLVLFYVTFWVMGLPFNKVTNWADRSKVGPTVFHAGRLTPKC